MARRDDQGFVAHLHRLAGARSRGALNHQVTLRNILTGTTCAPISLEDFELYLAYRELSIENLQFVIWFHDYQQRFSSLPIELQRMSPDPVLHNGSHTSVNLAECSPQVPSLASLPQLYSPTTISSAGSTRGKRSRSRPPRLNLARGGYPSSSSIVSPSSDAHSTTPITSSILSPFTPFSDRTLLSSNSPFSTPVTPPSAFPPSPGASTSDQPFRDETLRIVATFMRPGLSKKELPLDESIREKVLADLAWTTHPNVFLPIYRFVYEQLEMSVRNFLSISSANINRPKQLYWYAAGSVFLTIALLIATLTTQRLPAYKWTTAPITPPQSPDVSRLQSIPWKRGYRLISVPFSAIGSMQVYSAWRGFCSEIFGRGSTQLKAWELSDPKEVGVKWRRRRKNKSKPNEPGEEAAGGDGEDGNHHADAVGPDSSQARDSANDHWLIAPFADANMRSEVASSHLPPATPLPRPVDVRGPVSSGSSAISPTLPNSAHPLMMTHEVAFVAPRSRGAQGGYKRPPVFGPERVVLDERIRKFHQSVLDDMAFFGLCWTVVWTIVVVSLPGPKPLPGIL